jgi:hypothetical protein
MKKKMELTMKGSMIFQRFNLPRQLRMGPTKMMRKLTQAWAQSQTTSNLKPRNLALVKNQKCKASYSNLKESQT